MVIQPVNDRHYGAVDFASPQVDSYQENATTPAVGARLLLVLRFLPKSHTTTECQLTWNPPDILNA